MIIRIVQSAEINKATVDLSFEACMHAFYCVTPNMFVSKARIVVDPKFSGGALTDLITFALHKGAKGKTENLITTNAQAVFV